MNKMKLWFQTITFGETAKYIKLTLWNFLDSFVISMPHAVMLIAIYLLLIPVAEPTKPLPYDRIWMLCGILLAQAVLYFFIRRKTYIDVCCKFADSTKNSRLSMGEHLRKLSMGFFSKRDAGDLSTVLLRDYTEVESLASGLIPRLSVIVIRLTLSFIVLTAFEWRMMLAVLIVIPIALPFAIISYKAMGKVSSKMLLAQQDAASGILEYVGGIQTLKAFNQAGQHFATLKKSFSDQRKHSIGVERAAAPIGILGRFILNCGISLVMLVGIVLLTAGELSPFYYIAFLLISLNVYEPVLIFFSFIADFARTNKSTERIIELKNEKPLKAPVKEKVPSKMDIRFEHVSFSYGNKKVLKDASMYFPQKSLTALVGPSGSGKSTITRLIARFWDVDEGVITLGGVPVTEMSADTLLSKISVVFQDVYLFHNTIEENIRMGRSDASFEEVVTAAKTAACHEFIISLPEGYQAIVGEGGSTLSGGEKQRISIARALLKDAPIVLLDEATASLDPENEVLIQQAISALVAEKTVIVIAHRLQSICNADQIIVLEEGTITESGAHKELLQSGGLYAKLWMEQNKAGHWRL